MARIMQTAMHFASETSKYAKLVFLEPLVYFEPLT